MPQPTGSSTSWKEAVAAVVAEERPRVPCHVCGAREASPFLSARGYKVVRCRRCGLLYVNPQPTEEELARLYAQFDQGDQWRVHEEPFNRGMRELILRARRSGSVLDVGCGSGNFLRQMREGGFQVCGIEPSESGCRYARETLGIEVFHGTIEQFPGASPGRRFEVVTLLNVLEHLTRPAETLEAAREILKKDGLLFVVVPDARLHALLAAVRRLAGSRDPFWMEADHQPVVAFDPPFHLTCFEPATLRRMLKQCGFEIVQVRNAPVIFNARLWKCLSKLGVAAAGRTLEWLSLGQIVFGYSTLAIARRP